MARVTCQLRIFQGVVAATLVASIWTWGRVAAAQDATDAEAPAAAEAVPADAPPSVLAVEPKTAEELFETVLLMVDIARPRLAQGYLDKFLATNPDEALLLSLRDKHGAVAFLRLSNIKELRPQSSKLLDTVNAAAARRASDPERIASLIAQLGATPEEQIAAREELRVSGSAVVPALLNVLNSTSPSVPPQRILQALIHIGQPAVPVLIAALDSPSVDLRAYVATTLGYLHDEDAIPFLWYPSISADVPEAVRMAARGALARLLDITPSGVEKVASSGALQRLMETAVSYYRNEHVWETNAAGQITSWYWDDQLGEVRAVQTTPEIANELSGLRFARQALALAPDQRKVQVLYLGLALSIEARRAGWDNPLPVGPDTAHDLALLAGHEVMGEVLAQALASGRPATAVAALQVLEKVGAQNQLKGTGTPLYAALNYPDQRVQLAAAVTVLQLDPQTPFAGAARVVSILNRALIADSLPRAVVADVNPERGSLVGGLVNELGYRPVVVTTGRECFQAAAERGDVELIILHPNVIRWALTETLANLRADARTAGIPIVIHGPAELREPLESTVKNYSRTIFAAAAQTAPDLELQMAPFLQSIKTPPLSPEQRAANASTAASWLAHLASGRRLKVFDISSSADAASKVVRNPQLTERALQILVEIPTAECQDRIAEVVLDTSLPEQLRESAALQLAFHVQRFGLLLTRPRVESLHLVRNQAKEPGLHAAISGFIGSLKPSSQLVGERLRNYRGAAPKPAN